MERVNNWGGAAVQKLASPLIKGARKGISAGVVQQEHIITVIQELLLNMFILCLQLYIRCKLLQI